MAFQQTNVRVVTVTEPQQNNNTYPNYRSKSSKVLGWLQLSLALLFIILQAVGIVLQKERWEKNFIFYTGGAFWCAPWFIISGALAVAAAKRQERCPVVGNLVMSVFSTIFAFILMSVCAALVTAEELIAWGLNDGNADEGSYAIGCVMLILTFIMMAVTIWSSSLGCMVACCGNNARNKAMVVHPGMMTTQQGVMMTTQPAVMMTTQPAVMMTTQQPMMQQPPVYTTSNGQPTYTTKQDSTEVHMPQPVNGSAYPGPVESNMYPPA